MAKKKISSLEDLAAAYPVSVGISTDTLTINGKMLSNGPSTSTTYYTPEDERVRKLEERVDELERLIKLKLWEKL